MYRSRDPRGSAVLLAPLLALAACGPRESGDVAPGTASSLDSPDRTLAIEAEPVYRVGGFESPDWATFGSIRSVRFDGDGNLYVLDSQADQVTVIGPDGSFLRTVGKQGEGPGEISNPFAFLVLPDGAVAIYDFAHRGFVIYGPDGEYVRTVTADFQVVGLPARDIAFHPSGGAVSGSGGQIRINRGGNVEATPPTRPVAYYPLSEGGEARVIYRAWDLPEEPDEDNQSLQMSGGGAVRIAMPAERAFEPGLSVGVLPDGRVVVADSMGYRLKLLNLEGQVVGTLERPVRPTEVTPAIERQERERRLGQLEEGEGPQMVLAIRGSGGSGGGQVDPQAVREMEKRRLESMTFAPVIPVIEDMAVDPAGRIWVQRSGGVPGEDGPTDLLTSEGGYLGTIPADGLRIPEAFGPGGLIVRIETDEFDVPTLVVERLPELGEAATDG